MKYDDIKDFAFPLPLLDELKREHIAICFFPGIKRRRLSQDIPDFRDCLPFLGGGDVLIFCELNKSKEEIRDHVAQQVGTERDGIRIRDGLSDDLTRPLPVQDQLFPRCEEDPPDWVPDYAKPPIDRFWAVWSVLGIMLPGGVTKTLHLIHLGIGGHAAWLYFINSHHLEIAKIIIDPKAEPPEPVNLGGPMP